MNFILDHIPLWAYLVFGGLVTATLLYFFSPILIPLWQMLPRPIKSALILVVSVIGALLAGRYKGAKDERDAEARRNAAAIQKRTEVDADVSKLSNKDVKSGLSNWQRD
jgi:hypothetical protein